MIMILVIWNAFDEEHENVQARYIFPKLPTNPLIVNLVRNDICYHQ